MQVEQTLKEENRAVYDNILNSTEGALKQSPKNIY